jgi:hypothetical protein
LPAPSTLKADQEWFIDSPVFPDLLQIFTKAIGDRDQATKQAL